MNLADHKAYSEERLNVIRERVQTIPELSKNSLCIFATGSYGRLEASENSDLDLFFLDSAEEKPTSNIDKTLINANVIKICREVNLPEFSKDGGYLTIHNIGDILHYLGSQQDDAQNYFTARMLLLLESRQIYNKELHSKCLEQVIERYFIDFHNHSASFKAVFLTNDIIRFWKTLCLNYEHSRQLKAVEGEIDQDKQRAVAHSKNLKLKFSRKLTCFSFIIKLASFTGTVTQNDLLEICKLTPTERLSSIRKSNPEVSDKVDSALANYQWFLDRTQIPSSELLHWISDKEKRSEAFDNSTLFGDELFEILKVVDSQKLLGKLLI